MNPLPNRIMACALKVQHMLDTGFLEKIHDKALAHELVELKAVPTLDKVHLAQCFEFT
ncbi:MAG TPA: hypothetical protein VGI78_20045 [Acetobacteraceae bacterium]